MSALITNPALEEAKKKIKSGGSTGAGNTVINSNNDSDSSSNSGIDFGSMAKKGLGYIQNLGISMMDVLQNQWKDKDKQTYYDQYKQLTGSGMDKTSAITKLAIANGNLNSSPDYPEFKSNNSIPTENANFGSSSNGLSANSSSSSTNSSFNTSILDDPNINLSVEERNLAQAKRDKSKIELNAFTGKIKKKWDESFKPNIDSLMNLAGDENYAKWLSNIGLTPDSIMKLSQGRQNYIESYAEEMRKSFGNDLAYMENLQGIKDQAEKDYLSKAKLVTDEIERFKNNQDTVIGKGVNETGDMVLIFKDKNTGKPYTQVMQGIRSQVSDFATTKSNPFSQLNNIENMKSPIITLDNGFKANTLTNKSAGSRSWRNNNPGNLRPGTIEKAQEYWGADNVLGIDENGFAIFKDEKVGRQALLQQIKVDSDRGMTLEQFISKYAPAQENDTQSYIRNLQKQLNIPSDLPISKIHDQNLADAIQKHEGWIMGDNYEGGQQDQFNYQEVKDVFIDKYLKSNKQGQEAIKSWLSSISEITDEKERETELNKMKEALAKPDKSEKLIHKGLDARGNLQYVIYENQDTGELRTVYLDGLTETSKSEIGSLESSGSSNQNKTQNDNNSNSDSNSNNDDVDKMLNEIESML